MADIPILGKFRSATADGILADAAEIFVDDTPITDILDDLQDQITAAATPEVTINTDGNVTQELTAGTLYHFIGALTSLTVTFAPATGTAHYHFDFLSGAVAVVLSIPNTVNMQDGFAVEPNARYEIDILNGWGVGASWPLS